MYIIHNKTKNITTHYEGSWSSALLEEYLEKGDRLIVISLYSNTIKIPYKLEYNGIEEWEWEDFPFLK